MSHKAERRFNSFLNAFLNPFRWFCRSLLNAFLNFRPAAKWGEGEGEGLETSFHGPSRAFFFTVRIRGALTLVSNCQVQCSSTNWL